MDVVVTMLTMLGFVNLVLTLFEPVLVDFVMAIQASLYLFEIIATSYISSLFNAKPKGESVQLNSPDEKA